MIYQIQEAMQKKLWRDVYSKRCHAEIPPPPEEVSKLISLITLTIEKANSEPGKPPLSLVHLYEAAETADEAEGICNIPAAFSGPEYFGECLLDEFMDYGTPWTDHQHAAFEHKMPHYEDLNFDCDGPGAHCRLCLKRLASLDAGCYDYAHCAGLFVDGNSLAVTRCDGCGRFDSDFDAAACAHALIDLLRRVGRQLHKRGEECSVADAMDELVKRAQVEDEPEHVQVFEPRKAS